MQDKPLASPPGPGTARDAAAFVEAMNRLRTWAGTPSFRRLCLLGGTTLSVSGDEVDALPPTTTSYVLRGKGLPKLPRAEFADHFVAACLRAAKVDAADIGEHLETWRASWRAIAAGDADEPAPAAPVPGPVPAELPGLPATFTGRRDEVAKLSGLLRSGIDGTMLICAITGPGGTGKSSLAIKVAHEVADHFPGGCLYADLHGATPGVSSLTPMEVLRRFLRSLGLSDAEIPWKQDEAATRLRTLLAGRRILMVLDNAVAGEQVRALLPGTSDTAVVITSRDMFAGFDGVTHHALGALEADDAVDLLGRHIGHERVQEDAAAAASIVRLCDRLPLAIGIAAARLVKRPGWPLSRMAERLADEHGRLDELQVSDRAVRSSFRVGYAGLGVGARRMFRLLGVAPGVDVSVDVAAALAGLSVHDTEDLLDQLTEGHLVDPHAVDRYRLHDLLRLFARERCVAEDPEPERTQAERRLLHCYLGSARTATKVLFGQGAAIADLEPRRLLHPGVVLTTNEDVYAWVDAETANLPELVRRAADPSFEELAVTLTDALFFPLEAKGRHNDQLLIGQAVLPAVERTDDPLAVALGHGALGRALLRLGDPQDAEDHLRKALAARHAIGEPRGEAGARDNLALAALQLGRLEEGIAHLEAAIPLYRQAGYPLGVAGASTNLGLAYEHAARYTDALAAHRQALVASREAEWVSGIPTTLGNLASALHRAGEPEAAVSYYREALQADAEAGDAGTYAEADHLWGLGRALDDLGRSDQARAAWRQAAVVLLDLGLITPEEKAAIDAADRPATPEVIKRNL